MKFVLLCSLILISGCGYPRYQLQKMDDATFKNKRFDKKTVYLREFIRPEETKEFLQQRKWQSFSPDQEKNTVLNILYFVQQINKIREVKEHWQYPAETIKKGGDCEDKAFLLLSMLMQAGVKEVYGVKGHLFGGGHMWVEYKEYILDPSLKITKLIPASKSIGYTPFFKFDKENVYFCATAKGE